MNFLAWIFFCLPSAFLVWLALLAFRFRWHWQAALGYFALLFLYSLLTGGLPEGSLAARIQGTVGLAAAVLTVIGAVVRIIGYFRRGTKV